MGIPTSNRKSRGNRVRGEAPPRRGLGRPGNQVQIEDDVDGDGDPGIPAVMSADEFARFSEYLPTLSTEQVVEMATTYPRLRDVLVRMVTERGGDPALVAQLEAIDAGDETPVTVAEPDAPVDLDELREYLQNISADEVLAAVTAAPQYRDLVISWEMAGDAAPSELVEHLRLIETDAEQVVDPDAPEFPSTSFDPSEHNIPDVVAYLAQHPEDLARVRQLEAAGKARVTLLEQIDSVTPKT